MLYFIMLIKHLKNPINKMLIIKLKIKKKEEPPKKIEHPKSPKIEPPKNIEPQKPPKIEQPKKIE